ncbi:MAG TPA: hypothetical protein VGW12_07850 [Pyrinomonadaceae bacterium]|nr:hypothetical protein [Pyrinomonadaceae bacterium]
MSKNPTDYTLEHLTVLAGAEPSLWDLLYVKDLWTQLHHYWWVFNGEIQRRLGKFESIRVLDFDLIYPAIWPAEVQNPLSLEERMGFPMTASFIFRDTKSLFTIPPGAFYELSYHLNKLRSSFDSSESRLQRMMNAVRRLHGTKLGNQKHNTFTAIKTLEDMAVECEQEVDRLIEIGVRLEGLNNILEHPYYRPWEEIAEKAGAIADPVDVFRFWKIFEADRTHPEKDFSNYLDALNVASYYALSKARTSGKSPVGFSPLFASGTRVILNLPPSIGQKDYHRPSLLEEVIHPVSIQYLAFATALENYAEYALPVLSSIAENGFKGIQKLERRWGRFWNEVTLTLPLAQQSDIESYFKSIPLRQFNALESFSGFCESYTTWKKYFDAVVGSIFFNVTRADRQLSENHALVKQRLLADFKEYQLNDRLVTANESVSEITSSFKWSHLASLVDSHLVFQHKAQRSVDEITLKSLRDAQMILERSEVFAAPDPTLRTAVHLAHAQQLLFYWERTAGHSAQLCCWEYDTNIKELLDCISSFLIKAHSEFQRESTATLKIYANNLFKQVTINADLSKGQLLDTILRFTPAPNYIRIETSSCIVFSDVVPPDPMASLEIAVMYEKPHLHQLVADLFQQTSTLPMPTQMIAALLEEYARDFQRIEGRIKKFAKSLGERRQLQSGSFSLVQPHVG